MRVDSRLLRQRLGRRLVILLGILLTTQHLSACSTESANSDGAGSNSASSPAATSLQTVKCWFPVPRGKQADCAWYRAAPARGDDPGIRLPVVRIRQADGTRPPLVFVAGGPGYPAGLNPEQMPDWFAWAERMAPDRDLVLYEQRGTGLAAPQLDCPKLLPATAKMLGQHLSPQAEFNRITPILVACRNRLQSDGVELTQYTTPHNARDIIGLMQAFGDERYSLYGVSYGSRVALQVMQQAPETLEAVVLDSVYPLHIDSLLVQPALFGRLPDLLENACSKSPDCRTAHPNWRERWDKLLLELREQPWLYRLKRADTGERFDFVLNEWRLLPALLDALYYPGAALSLASAIGDQNAQALRPVLQQFSDWLFDVRFADGTYLSVECQDRPQRFTSAEYAAEVDRFPSMRRYTEMLTEIDPCPQWIDSAKPKELGPWPATPTLLLAGENDPVTPANWAEDLAKELPGAVLMVVANVGHSVVDASACAERSARQFLAKPTEPPPDYCDPFASNAAALK